MGRSPAIWIGAAGALLLVGGTIAGVLASHRALHLSWGDSCRVVVAAGLAVALGCLLVAVRSGPRSVTGTLSLALRVAGVLDLAWSALPLLLPDSSWGPAPSPVEGLVVYGAGEALRLADRAVRLRAPPSP